MKQELHLILGVEELTDPTTDALFEAGFDDSHLTKYGGRPRIVIDDHDITNLAAGDHVAVADATLSIMAARN